MAREVILAALLTVPVLVCVFVFFAVLLLVCVLLPVPVALELGEPVWLFDGVPVCDGEEDDVAEGEADAEHLSSVSHTISA